MPFAFPPRPGPRKGGSSHYYQARGLERIHAHIHIAPADAAAWLGHAESAAREVGMGGEVRRELQDALRPIARALVNEAHPARPSEHRCERTKPAKQAVTAARRGDTGAALAILSTPERLREWGPEVLYAAAERGRLEVVRGLLDAGVDANVAAPLDWGEGAQPPLLGALRKRRREVVALLRERGAVDDVFVAAALGDLEGVRVWIERDPGLLHATDPAQDVHALTALHHAVIADQPEVALFLLDRGARVGQLGGQLLRRAVDNRRHELAARLLDAGAEAARTGPGRWVLDPELAPLLAEHGADVNDAPVPHESWTWEACTGHHDQRDDPEYVRALIDHGADPEATYGWGRSALHFAANAGFASVVQVLLDAGADPNRPDERDGATPLFHAFRAGKSVDPTVVAELLLEHGADPERTDRSGRTVAQRHRAAAALLAARGT